MLKCEYHPGAKAVALCNGCSTPLCGICSNYEDEVTLCERCLKMYKFTRATTPPKAEEKPAPRAGKAGAMAKLLAEGEVQQRSQREDVDKRTERKKEEEQRGDKWLMGVVIISCVFIAYRITNTIQDNRPLTVQEIAAQDARRDGIANCVQVFWEIASILQNNRTPPSSLQCAEAGGPMLVTQLDNDIIVRHPRPDLLGFSEIVVSRSNPVPELIE